MSAHFEQPTQQYSLCFNAVDNYDDCLESPTLNVRQRKKKVVRMQDMRMKVASLEGFSAGAQTTIRETEFCTLVTSPLKGGKRMPFVDMVSAMSSSMNFENVDLDFSSGGHQEGNDEQKEISLSPTKQYKEQNVAPRAVLNQCEALEKAMERRNSKQSFLSYLLW